jgi:hypothetical protein
MKLIFSVFLAVFLVLMPRFSFAEKGFSFEGQADFTNNTFNIVLDFGEDRSVTARAERSSEKDYSLSLDIDHLQTPVFDLLSEIRSSVEVVDSGKGEQAGLGESTFRGNIWSQYSLVDYKPINELSGRFEVKGGKIYLMALSVGNLRCEGYVNLVSPYDLNMAVYLSGIAMNDFLNFWGAAKEYESSGDVFGVIKASGTLGHLQLKGSLESHDGFVQKLHYDAIVLNAEGIYPHIYVAQSTVSQSDGVSFALNGPINLSDKANFKKQIKALTFAPLVDYSESGSEWTIKRLDPKGSETTEFKYQFKKGDALGVGPSSGNEIDMLGIERTNKF